MSVNDAISAAADQSTSHADGLDATAFRAALRAAGYVVEQGWQPIATAPRDGTEVLTLLDVGGVHVVHIAWYRSSEEWQASGQYCGGWESLAEFEGWWSYTEGAVSQSKLERHCAPTHWRPLPEGPV